MYKVEFSESAIKQLKKLDKQTSRIIKNWVIKNLVDCDDPRVHGKPLKGKLAGIWRYRVGDYRILAEIQDNRLVLILIDVGHRKDIYLF